jgi:hypothetical protein
LNKFHRNKLTVLRNNKDWKQIGRKHSNYRCKECLQSSHRFINWNDTKHSIGS